MAPLIDPSFAREEVRFRGHRLIKATHPTTLEITTEDRLTERGDCIIGIRAGKACRDLNSEIKSLIRRDDSVIDIDVVVGTFTHRFHGYGSPSLTLTHDKSIVVRRSRFTCSRTAVVRCDGSAKDLPREMVRLLKDEGVEALFVITARKTGGRG